MVRINTHNNITSEAGVMIDRFMEREFDGIQQDAVMALAGGEDCYFENLEELTPRVLTCDECYHEVTVGHVIDGEDGEPIEAEEDLTCPACIKKAGVKCDSCEVHGEEERAGDSCPCGEGTFEHDVSNCGTLEYNEDDEHGFLPALNRMWKCMDFTRREICADITIATDAGFRVYEVEGEIYLGIHGYGYNMDAPHFAPLYRRLLDQKLPGDPVECPNCGGNSPAADSGEQVCDVCNGDGVVPYVTSQQKREEQREAAMELIRNVATFQDSEISNPRLGADLREIAREIVGMTD